VATITLAEVDHADIDIGHPAGMMVAQEEAQLIHYPRDWPRGVAISPGCAATPAGDAASFE
jgi:hypothetical protein